MRVPFEIPITDDSVYEGDEDFVLTIDSSSLPTGGSVGDPGQATVTILDDDRKLQLCTKTDTIKVIGSYLLLL